MDVKLRRTNIIYITAVKKDKQDSWEQGSWPEKK
jgi:hypothetical protein